VLGKRWKWHIFIENEDFLEIFSHILIDLDLLFLMTSLIFCKIPIFDKLPKCTISLGLGFCMKGVIVRVEIGLAVCVGAAGLGWWS
jgi:hypothetical protein